MLGKDDERQKLGKGGKKECGICKRMKSAHEWVLGASKKKAIIEFDVPGR